jgi:hypothetical protein
MATARQTADRSAQIVNPYDEFSTLHPEITSPVAVNTAAPTANPE